jgi:ClpP class serine protease
MKMTTRNKHILTSICSSQWLIDESYFQLLLSVVNGEGDREEAMLIKEENERTRTVLQEAVAGTDVAIIPIIGPIIPRATTFSRVCGITDLDMLHAQFQSALDDESVGKILFYYDSPGGHVTGINEFADKIFESRGIKPIEGYVGGTSASASFWLSSAVDKLSLDATARVGSVGVVVAIPKNDGTYVEIVNSNSPKKRLDPEKAEDKNEMVRYLDALADVFFEKLSRNFGIDDTAYVKENFGKGGIRVGSDAVKYRMAHEVSSLQKVVSRLAALGSTESSQVAAEDVDEVKASVVSEEVNENEFVEGGTMTKAELKEKHPELFAAIEADAKAGMVDQEQLASLEKENTQLKNDHRDLIMANTSMSTTLAKSIFDASFSNSTLPKALKPKFEKLVDHKNFVAENGVLDAEAYKAALDTEITEWAEAGKFAASDKEDAILGVSTENKAEDTGIIEGEEKTDDVAARMLAHLN